MLRERKNKRLLSRETEKIDNLSKMYKRGQIATSFLFFRQN